MNDTLLFPSGSTPTPFEKLMVKRYKNSILLQQAFILNDMANFFSTYDSMSEEDKQNPEVKKIHDILMEDLISIIESFPEEYS